jgi:uncharacterized RDD family membrane protein YckC
VKKLEPEPSRLGHYAGPVTRAAAYFVDMAISLGVFTLVIAVTLFLLNLTLQTDLSQDSGPAWFWTTLLLLWGWLYFGGSWAASGKTPGMGLLGVRVVARDGAPLDPWRGILRAPYLLAAFFTFGIGFVGIVIGRQHRALQDVLAGSVVVYDWDARTARLRFLARRGHQAPTPPRSDLAEPDLAEPDLAEPGSPS